MTSWPNPGGTAPRPPLPSDGWAGEPDAGTPPPEAPLVDLGGDPWERDPDYGGVGGLAPEPGDEENPFYGGGAAEGPVRAEPARAPFGRVPRTRVPREVTRGTFQPEDGKDYMPAAGARPIPNVPNVPLVKKPGAAAAASRENRAQGALQKAATTAYKAGILSLYPEGLAEELPAGTKRSVGALAVRAAFAKTGVGSRIVGRKVEGLITKAETLGELNEALGDEEGLPLKELLTSFKGLKLVVGEAMRASGGTDVRKAVRTQLRAAIEEKVPAAAWINPKKWQAWYKEKRAGVEARLEEAIAGKSPAGDADGAPPAPPAPDPAAAVPASGDVPPPPADPWL